MLSLDGAAYLQPYALVWFQPQRPLCCEHLACNQVGEAVARPVRPQLVGIHLLRMLGEIRYDEESLAAAMPVWEKTHADIEALLPDGDPERLRRDLRALS